MIIIHLLPIGIKYVSYYLTSEIFSNWPYLNILLATGNVLFTRRSCRQQFSIFQHPTFFLFLKTLYQIINIGCSIILSNNISFDIHYFVRIIASTCSKTLDFFLDVFNFIMKDSGWFVIWIWRIFSKSFGGFFIWNCIQRLCYDLI